MDLLTPRILKVLGKFSVTKNSERVVKKSSYNYEIDLF